jgi:hypothetical protein
MAVATGHLRFKLRFERSREVQRVRLTGQTSPQNHWPSPSAEHTQACRQTETSLVHFRKASNYSRGQKPTCRCCRAVECVYGEATPVILSVIPIVTAAEKLDHLTLSRIFFRWGHQSSTSCSRGFHQALNAASESAIGETAGYKEDQRRPMTRTV